jgi:hypothetical protein
MTSRSPRTGEAVTAAGDCGLRSCRDRSVVPRRGCAAGERPDQWFGQVDSDATDGSKLTGVSQAGTGLLLAIVGGFFLAQAGGGDREMFLSISFMLLAAGFLGMLIGGVALGVQLARRGS